MSRSAGCTLARAALVALAAVAALALGPAQVEVAWAHGVLRASDPGAGAVVDQSPAALTLSFTEAPELAFSSVKVLDGTGRSFGAGDLQPVAGDPETLSQPIQRLPKGVYTVSWRIVSRVDGHLTAGSFAFGVQTPVTAAAAAATQDGGTSLPGNQSVAAVAGRALLYSGVACLLGAAWVGLLLFRGRRPGLAVLLAAGLVAALAGVVALGLAQRSTTGASLDVFLQSRLGRAVLWRVIGILAAGAGVVLAVRARRWRLGLALVAAGTLGTIVAHVESGHAAAASPAWVAIGLQVAHVVTMAVWVGGLAALLAGLGRERNPAADPAAAPAARTFSAVALGAVGALAVTGVLRAINEVDGWGPLVDSTYGRLVLVKGVLLVVIAVLGAVNRYRHVPIAGRSLTGLRRIGTAEVTVAVAVFVVTGFLATSPPPATAKVTETAIVVTASDFGTTVRARLTASPGQAGQNRFTVRLTDYDTGDPVAAARVTARFALPAAAGVSPSTLELPSTGPGTFAASGANLTLPGRWRVTLVVERGTDSLELSFDLVTRTPPGLVTVTPGEPTIYSVALGQGRTVQVYADPEAPGPTELHATFFSATGVEEPVDVATVTTDGATTTPRQLGPGHFVADVDATGGAWPVEVTGVTPGGDYLYAPFTLKIER